MNRRIVSTFLSSLAVIIFFLCYGPSRRNFAEQETAVHVATPADIVQLWKTAGVKGRMAVVFTRRLNAEEVKEGAQGQKYLETAMMQGVVRGAYHVVPDSVWSEVAYNVSRMPGVRKTSAGFALLFDQGRVELMPLSQFVKVKEKALVVVEPSIWSPNDLSVIQRLVATRRVTADLLAVLNGSDSDFNAFNNLLGSRQK